MQDVNKFERGKVISSKSSAQAKLIRNKQATAMLEASLGINRVIEGIRAGIQDDLSIDDLEEISNFLRHSIYS
jgi:hypothetical protein